MIIDMQPRVITLLFPLIGYFPAIVVSICKYWGKLPVNEPFSAFSNLSYISGAIGILTFPLFLKDENHAASSRVELFLLLLGTGSFVFHVNGSDPEKCESHIDRVFMFVTLLYIVLISIDALFIAKFRQHALFRLTLSTIFYVCFALVVILQKYVNTAIFFLCTGALFFIANFMTNILIVRRNCLPIRFVLTNFATQIFLMVCSYILLTLGGESKKNDVRYDFSHGCWHILTSIVVCNSIITVYCSYTKYNFLSCCYSSYVIFFECIVAITMLILSCIAPNFTVWITVLLILQIIVVSFLLFPIFQSNKKFIVHVV